MVRFAVRFFLLASIAVLAAFPAYAGTHVSVGVGLWEPAYYGHPYRPYHPYWGPRYYGPRAVVIYPAAPAYYPAPYPAPYPGPVYAQPAPAAIPVATQQCTQYNGDATVDGSGQPFYGRACLFTDGRWHIIP
jgi:hypothetical protein